MPLIKRGNRLFLAVSGSDQSPGLDETRVPYRTDHGCGTGRGRQAVRRDDVALQAWTPLSGPARLCGPMDNLEWYMADDAIGEGVQLDVDAPAVRYVIKILLDVITNSTTSTSTPEPHDRVRFSARTACCTRRPNSRRSISRHRPAACTKVMARMNIAGGVPGRRIKWSVAQPFDRFPCQHCCPTVYGGKVVLRILDSSAATPSVESSASMSAKA